MDTESNNWNEKEGNQQHGMGRQGRMENKNRTLGTEICENIDTLLDISNYGF